MTLTMERALKLVLELAEQGTLDGRNGEKRAALLSAAELVAVIDELAEQEAAIAMVRKLVAKDTSQATAALLDIWDHPSKYGCQLYLGDGETYQKRLGHIIDAARKAVKGE